MGLFARKGKGKETLKDKIRFQHFWVSESKYISSGSELLSNKSLFGGQLSVHTCIPFALCSCYIVYIKNYFQLIYIVFLK